MASLPPCGSATHLRHGPESLQQVLLSRMNTHFLPWRGQEKGDSSVSSWLTLPAALDISPTPCRETVHLGPALLLNDYHILKLPETQNLLAWPGVTPFLRSLLALKKAGKWGFVVNLYLGSWLHVSFRWHFLESWQKNSCVGQPAKVPVLRTSAFSPHWRNFL